ncbi:uncharacterized protein PgNI_09521 [Pyricularia grisea]|uniref:Uncharacterized protein n=1 Tax=Pyricularia grisea TaxID=148305 RepID=A0A6P8ATF5_PYRGI|nr:uncharacterized protein PgNI_09521 [Pyricularia grisea]TLD05411.1 hypothetical protein PgNI_09521 [Pyricularia grisea]
MQETRNPEAIREPNSVYEASSMKWSITQHGGECAPPCASQETGTVRVVVVTSPSQGSRAREPWPRESPIALQARDGDGWGQASPRRDLSSSENTPLGHKKSNILAFLTLASMGDSATARSHMLLFFPTLEGGAQQKIDQPVDHDGKLCSRSNQSSVGHPVLGSVIRDRIYD